MKLRLGICASAVGLLAISGCSQIPIEFSPDTFEPVAQGQYEPSKQALLADCVFDGWDTVMNLAAPSQARLVKRAWGYRVDAISLTNKLMTAELRDDGTYTVSRMKERRTITTLEPEIKAATACLQKYGATASKPGSKP